MNSHEIEIAISKKHTDDFFITECKNGPTWFGDHLRMDAVAIKKSWTRPLVTVYEVKVSRNDFLRDDKWPQYLQYCNRFYFACPSGLIKINDIDDPRVGLIWVNENGNCITKKSIPARATDIPGSFYQYILFSRIDSERIPFYSEKEEYIREYIQHKKSTKSLGCQLSSAMIERLSELEDKHENKDLIEKKLKAYDELMEIFRANGFYYSSPDEIGKVLARSKKSESIEYRINRFIDEVEEIKKLWEK